VAELATLRRPHKNDDRRASELMAEGNFDAGLQIYQAKGAINWTRTQPEARAATVAQWTRDNAKIRFAFAYANADVDQLNRAIRAVRKERGELEHEDHAFKHGRADFSAGDRIQFTGTDKPRESIMGRPAPFARWAAASSKTARSQNLSELLKRAQWGKITDAELSEVVRMIASERNGDLYTLIQILGRAGSPKYRTIVEPYLHDVGNSQISALALKVLCRWWGLTREYKGELVRFLNGVDWDVDGYVRLQAIGLVGEYLQENSDKELLQIIYNIFSNNGERLLIRSAAYFALCRSEKIVSRDLRPSSLLVDFSKEINREVLERVERKLGGCGH